MLKCPPTHCCSVSQAWVRQKLKLDAEAERQYNKRKEPEVKGLAESLKDSSAYLEKTADNLKKFADERGQYHAGADVLLAEGSEEADKSGTEEPEGGRTQTRLPFAPSGARPEAHKPSLLAQNAATLQHEREVQARFRAAAAAQRHEKELERQDDTRHGGAQGAPAGARGARSGEAPARSQSLLCPRAPAVRIRPASLLGHDGRPDGAALTSAGLNVEQAKTLYMPSFGREYQRY